MQKKPESVGDGFFFHASVRAARLECTVEVTFVYSLLTLL